MTPSMTRDLACQLGDHGVGSLGLKVGVGLSLRGEAIHLDVNFSAFLLYYQFRPSVQKSSESGAPVNTPSM